MITRISHVAIASNDIDKARRLFHDLLGMEIKERETVADQKITTDIYTLANGNIEILEPSAQDSPISRFLEKRGEGIHHICFEVSNLERMLKKLHDNGVELIDESPRTGAGGAKIAFLHPKSTYGVLIELCEPAGQADRNNL